MWRIFDSVIHSVERYILTHPPERGGALLGLPGTSVITAFVYDEAAQVTATSFCPSSQLNTIVQEIEQTGYQELKGLLHSHPGGYDQPSTQDIQESGVALALNPHLSTYLLPIVTHVPTAGPTQAHEVLCAGGKISFYAVYRTRIPECPRVSPVSVKVIPMEDHFKRLCEAFGGIEPPKICVTPVEGHQMIAVQLRLRNVELLVLTSDLYPGIPPLFLMTGEDGVTEQVQTPWPLDIPAEQRLLYAVSTFLSGTGPYHKAYGLHTYPALTTDPRRAEQADWSARYVSHEPALHGERIQEGLFARSGGLLSPAIREKQVLICGLGSVGSNAAELLVRSGVGRVTLVDTELVEPANLCRTVYNIADLGMPKTAALARRLLQINPCLDVTTHTKQVQRVGSDRLAELTTGADLIVAATDDNEAQRLLNHFAYAGGTPALFIGIYAGAQGGEVVLSIPDRTPCFLCATHMRHMVEAHTERVSPENDYGTGRLVGEVALGTDVLHITTAAVKMGLSLLLSPDTNASLRSFLQSQIEAGSTYLTMSTVENYWFYPALFANTSGQFAYQSVWLSPERRRECSVCGSDAFRVDPRESVFQVPRVEQSGPV